MTLFYRVKSTTYSNKCHTPGKNNSFRKSNVRHRPGHSLGKKSDEHLQCSPRSWLDDYFTQPFSWRSSLSRALDFLNKLFRPGVSPFKIHLPLLYLKAKIFGTQPITIHSPICSRLSWCWHPLVALMMTISIQLKIKAYKSIISLLKLSSFPLQFPEV